MIYDVCIIGLFPVPPHSTQMLEGAYEDVSPSYVEVSALAEAMYKHTCSFIHTNRDANI